MAEPSDSDVIDSIIANIDTSDEIAVPVPPPLSMGIASGPQAPPMMPQQQQIAALSAQKNRSTTAAAPMKSAAPVVERDWKDLLSLSLLKSIAVIAVLLFALFQPSVLDLIKSVIPESVPMAQFIPIGLVSILAAGVITVIQQFNLI